MKKPGLLLSLTPVIFLVILLVINVVIFKDDSSYGPNQIALFMSSLFSGVLGTLFLKTEYKVIEKGIVNALSSSIGALTILLVIGALIGAWILSGTVPTMISYGLKLINPHFFLPVSCLICSLISLSTGSSWSTTGTVGIALIGIGTTLGLDSGIVAGAVISGAYFGDKMSPLSDTTNLASAVAGTNLFTHIKHMCYTSGPAIIITLVIFTIIGLFGRQTHINTSEITTIQKIIEANFNISPMTLFPLVVVLIMIQRKTPALPAISFGIISAILISLFCQNQTYVKLNPNNLSIEGYYKTIIEVLFNGFKINSGHKVIDKLLNRGGMSGMLSTVWLIFAAMVFGGTLKATGMLDSIASSILRLVKGTGSLIGSTLGSCIVLNATASDQYLAIIVPGEMFRESYEKYNLAPENLSRALEDAGTVTSVLIPWNSGGAYNSSVLGVSTYSYAPYCFFNILSPCVSLFLATMNLTIHKKIKKSLEDKN